MFLDCAWEDGGGCTAADADGAVTEDDGAEAAGCWDLTCVVSTDFLILGGRNVIWAEVEKRINRRIKTGLIE
jgi:NAD/NADP transhydrogenase alpha subunit